MDNIVQTNINQRCSEMNCSFLGFVDGRYVRAKNKIIVQCNIDQHIWYPTYDNFRRGMSACPKCMGNPRATESERLAQIANICSQKNYTFLGFTTPTNNEERRMRIRCNADYYEWEVTYKNLVKRNTGCPKCVGLNKKTQDEALQLIQEKCITKNYTFISFVEGGYKNVDSRILVRCNKHKHEWSVKFSNFTSQDNGCPICKESKSEALIRQYLTDHNIQYIPQKTFSNCKNIKTLPFDFYLPDHNACIEYDGQHHFKRFSFEKDDKAFKIRQKNDAIKTHYCAVHKIKLLRISYKDSLFGKLNAFFTNANHSLD